MFIEELINDKYFFHYLNLYNYYNLKLLYKSIITDVPFLEIEENKMLSFNGKKEYTKGTISNQLQEYVNKQNLINYIDNRNKKFISSSFYDKFFSYNPNKDYLELQDYSKTIKTNAYLGLYPFKLSPNETITSKININQKNKLYFLLTCEILPTGKIFLKAFNEKLLVELLNNNDYYNLKFNYNIKNKTLINILNDLYMELYFYLYKSTNSYNFINKKNLIKEIDKLLTLIEQKKENKKYFYQFKNKINFLFYENENIVNNNLHTFYKINYIDNFLIKKKINNETKTIKYKNTLNNKNIIDLYFKMIDKNHITVGRNIVINYKNKLFNLNNLENIKEENFEDYISIIYIINLILKRKGINKTYLSFLVGKDKKLKDYGLDVNNINFNMPLYKFINLKYNKQYKIEKEYEKFNKIKNIIDNYDNISNLIDFLKQKNEIFKNDFKTYDVDYITHLKSEKNKFKYNYLPKEKTWLEKLIEFFIEIEEEKRDVVVIDGIKYKKSLIDKVSLEASKAKINETIFEMKENFYLDFNDFNEFTLNDLKVLYIKSVLKNQLNDKMKDIYIKHKEIFNQLIPVQFGKSNTLIEILKDLPKIDNIVIDKPDNIPLYYLFPMLYQSDYIFTYKYNYQKKTTGYWSVYNPKILVSYSNYLKEKIIGLLKLSNIYETEKNIFYFIHKQVNFSNFTENYSLLSIKKLLKKIIN